MTGHDTQSAGNAESESMESVRLPGRVARLRGVRRGERLVWPRQKRVPVRRGSMPSLRGAQRPSAADQLLRLA